MSEIRIVDPKTGGEKGRKPERFDLFPFDALEEVARVYGVGAEKYADDNWLKGYAWRLSAGALLRHVAKWMVGQNIDDGPGGTGCHHLACAAWHCLTLLTFSMRGLGTDDRAVTKKPEAGFDLDAYPDDAPIPYVPTDPGGAEDAPDTEREPAQPASKFRIGDVVRHKIVGCTGVIRSCGDWDVVVRWPEGWGRTPATCGALARNLELLRRPVQVGDEIRFDGFLSNWSYVVTRIEWPELWGTRDGEERYITSRWPTELVHADGTKIEPVEIAANETEPPICGAV